MKQQRYPIYEIFRSFQGEGYWAGTPALFLRLYGCDQHCPWCDSAGTWHPDYLPEPLLTLDPQKIADLLWMKSHGEIDFVVITGGEPTLYPLRPLTDAIRNALPNLRIHLETAGHVEFSARESGIDWVTVSPKLFDGAKPVVDEVLQQANEIKFVISSLEDLNRAIKIKQQWGYRRDVLFYLNPEWSKRNDPVITASMVHAAINYGFRLGWQIHKLYRADNLDPHARKEQIPLGGVPERGDAQ